MPPHIRAAKKTVEEYDPNLTLGRHEQTGDWVVMLRRGEETVPVFGLGVELPSPEAIKEKLYKSDVRRHGGKILQALVRDEDRRRAAAKAAADDASGQAAEGFAWAARKEGFHPSPRIFVPKGV